MRVIEEMPDRFEVVGLAAHSSVEGLLKQTLEHSPAQVAVFEEKAGGRGRLIKSGHSDRGRHQPRKSALTI